MIKIREALEEDYPVILELFKEFAEFERVPEKMVNNVQQMKHEKEFFKSFVAQTEHGAIVGYVTYFFSYHTWIGKSLYIDDLYVKNNYRGMGIGTSLMGKVISFARNSGCHKVRWQVSNWNQPAKNFYKGLGAEIGTTEQNCDLKL